MQDVLVQTVNVRLKNLSSQQASIDSGGFAGSAKSCWAFFMGMFGLCFAGVFDGP
jgi:hypothetical protein